MSRVRPEAPPSRVGAGPVWASQGVWRRNTATPGLILDELPADPDTEALVALSEARFPTRPGDGPIWDRLPRVIQRLSGELTVAEGRQEVAGVTAPGLGAASAETLRVIIDALALIADANRARQRYAEHHRGMSGAMVLSERMVWQLVYLMDNIDDGYTSVETGHKALDLTARRATETADELAAVEVVDALAHLLLAALAVMGDDYDAADASRRCTFAQEHGPPPGRLIVASPCAPHGPPATTTAPSSAAVLVLAA